MRPRLISAGRGVIDSKVAAIVSKKSAELEIGRPRFQATTRLHCRSQDSMVDVEKSMDPKKWQ